MISFTSVAVLFLSAVSAVRGAPIDKRDVPISKCTKIAEGPLRTANGHTLQIANGELVYGGSLHVEFQSCQPNFGQFDGNNGTPVGGHIYVPSVGKCLTANPDSSGSSGGPPFTFGLSDCYYSDDSGQVFSNFVKKSNGKIYYVGTTQADRDNIFWGSVCPSGFFGVPSRTKSGPVKFSCIDHGHVVGLNI